MNPVLPLSKAVTAVTSSDNSTEECVWTVCGRDYKCDKEKFIKSGLEEKYKMVGYIASGWYSQIFQAKDRKELTDFAVKVVNREGYFGWRFKQDITNFQKTKGEPAIIQCQEYYDLGKTGVIVVEWADGDMESRNSMFSNVKTDKGFRLLARQLLEGVDVLDRKSLYHDSLGIYDFLYVKEAGRVKLSGLERAVEREGVNNIKALGVVYSALKPIADNISLSDSSKELLYLLKNMSETAGELLKHKAFSSLPKDMTLDL